MFKPPSNLLLSNCVPMPHPYKTQRAGKNNPLLFQGYHQIDLLSHFDREHIPELVVHAKGSGAHSYFECANPIPEFTATDTFSSKVKKCLVTVRFSTIGGESGSHDLACDPRRFAVKLRTDEGQLGYHRQQYTRLPERSGQILSLHSNSEARPIDSPYPR